MRVLDGLVGPEDGQLRVAPELLEWTYAGTGYVLTPGLCGYGARQLRGSVVPRSRGAAEPQSRGVNRQPRPA